MLVKIKAVASSIWADIVDTYKRIKIPILGLLAIIGAIEFSRIKAALLVYLSQKQLQSAKKEDAVLTQSEKAANQQANMLVKRAESLPNTAQPVTEDWYEKK